jgi:hypothetical protein
MTLLLFMTTCYNQLYFLILLKSFIEIFCSIPHILCDGQDMIVGTTEQKTQWTKVCASG